MANLNPGQWAFLIIVGAPVGIIFWGMAVALAVRLVKAAIR